MFTLLLYSLAEAIKNWWLPKTIPSYQVHGKIKTINYTTSGWDFKASQINVSLILQVLIKNQHDSLAVRLENTCNGAATSGVSPSQIYDCSRQLDCHDKQMEDLYLNGKPGSGVRFKHCK